jgi:hypothetical protein
MTLGRSDYEQENRSLPRISPSLHFPFGYFITP